MQYNGHYMIDEEAILKAFKGTAPLEEGNHSTIGIYHWFRLGYIAASSKTTTLLGDINEACKKHGA